MNPGQDNSTASSKQQTPVRNPKLLKQNIDFYVDWNNFSLQDRFLNLFEAFNDFKLSVHIRAADKNPDISGILKFADFIREKQKKDFVLIDVETDRAIDDSRFQDIFERRLIVRFPILLKEDFSISDVSFENAANLSKYGLPVIFNLYLEKSFEPARIDEVIKELMVINYASGFSVYPANYALHPQVYGIPIETPQWLEILVDLYKNFPHYDVLFEPINEIVNITSFGGWNSNLNIPRFLKILVSRDGELRIFRENPHKAFRWTSLSEITSLTSSRILTNFIDTVNKHRPSVDTSCPHFEICRGIDDSCLASGSDEIPPLECETRRLFIRAFLEQIHTIRKRNCHESAGKK